MQFGVNRIADVTIDTRAGLTADESFAAAVENIGLQGGVAERKVAGKLEILPIAAEGDQSYGEAYEGLKGAGYGHVLAYEHVFAPASAPDQPLRVLADARSGQVLELRSEVVYATVTANIYPTTNSDALVNVGLPFVNVSNGGTKTTDASGTYTYGSGTATSSLNGKYIKMADACGAISLSASSPGNLAFGGAGGTNCTTPGVGGAGNTHSSRTGHYHLTRINRKAATFLTTNTWLSGVLTANMNINQTCNAFWNGSTVNFYRSGGGCSNTGEIAAVFLHEWGHGMDTKSGGAASDAASGEAVGDTFAFLETKDACIGKNFRPGVPCTNCNSELHRRARPRLLRQRRQTTPSPSRPTSRATPASTATATPAPTPATPARWATKATASPTSPRPPTGISPRPWSPNTAPPPAGPPWTRSGTAR